MMGAQQKLADVRGAAGLGGVCAWNFDKVCRVRGVNATSHGEWAMTRLFQAGITDQGERAPSL